MKELIGKLSRGIIEYNLPEVEVSVTDIDKSIEAGELYHGSFEIFSKDDNELKGIVYSTCEKFKIINDQFVGRNNKIEYVIDGKNSEIGDVIKGRVNIVSNGGELFIPYTIAVKEESIPSSIGDISNLFHFINLVKQEYDEGLKMFLSKDFERIILKDNVADKSLYNGLINSYSKKRALEEFMLAINKKQEVKIELSDTLREYDMLEESYGDILTLTRNTWGYIDIKVDVDGDFITEYKKNITEDDFAGNNYEFRYLIDISKLHSGMNYGKIKFYTMNQCLECEISIDNTGEIDSANHEIKKCIASLNEQYLNFRMRKSSIDTWAENSNVLIERARGFRDDMPFLKLLQAQMYISRRRDEEAKWLIDSVAEEILDKKEENVVLYCYYLYVRTLQKRKLEQTIIATDIIRKYYENGYDKWQLLWILLYIDTSFENNKSLKLTRIKEQYKIGCRSTLMYYEALYVLNKQPALLRVINSFELQVLNFGSKYDAIDLRLAVQISELAMLEKNFRTLLFNILVKLYDKFENKIILTAIISLLIRGNKTDEKYFKWYAKGVTADIQVTRLYEYYVYSMPEDYDGIVPNTVLMYYVYNGNQLMNREAFFYGLIIRNKDKQPNVYKNYRRNMEHFALDKLRNGEIDRFISVVYADVLTEEMITEENEKNLVKILNTWKLECDNDRIKEVIVRHKEIVNEQTFVINKGIAYINIYTDDAVVLLKDINGNIYHNTINYTLTKLYDNKGLNKIALERNPGNIYLMAKECEQTLKYHKSIPSGVSLFKEVMISNDFEEVYKDYIIQDIIDYYSNNYDGEELDEYLMSIDVSRLKRKSRVSVIELMIMRGLYDYAEKYLIEYGYSDIDPRKILKYCSRRLKEDKEIEEDKQLLEYCNYAFSKGKYNEIILDYLCRYYYGTTKEMMEIWRVSKEFEFESRDLEERLIAQMLFSRTFISSVVTIYDSYYKKGASEVIRYAYLFFMSHEYFIRENPVDDMFFKHLGDELVFDKNIMDICKCAYLKYQSDKKTISDTNKEICMDCMEYLDKKTIIFDFYKQFTKWFAVSDRILDKTTIVYRAEPQDKVLISYYLETGNNEEKEYTTEEMKCCFTGMYTKSFTLFYGEKLNYYITEISDGESRVTESKDHQLDDRNVEASQSRYGMLNDILMCMEMKQEGMISELAGKYYVNNELVKHLFR